MPPYIHTTPQYPSQQPISNSNQSNPPTTTQTAPNYHSYLKIELISTSNTITHPLLNMAQNAVTNGKTPIYVNIEKKWHNIKLETFSRP